MIVSVASGKGGTGKTTVSAALVSMWPKPVIGTDLDVEEPNLHLFLNPTIKGREIAELEIPIVDENRCTYCRKCSDLCQFKAISVFGEVVLTFPEMCHGCGGCMAICPENAITSGSRELGDISWGDAGGKGFLMGRLRVGEAMSPPLMRLVKNRLRTMIGTSGTDAIIDAPPGVSCPAVAAVSESDVIILVTEPTPFGLYDLELAHQAFSPFNIPMAVVVNRGGTGFTGVHEYCRSSGLDILCEIPFLRKIAEAYAEGKIISEASPKIQAIFSNLTAQIQAIGAENEKKSKSEDKTIA